MNCPNCQHEFESIVSDLPEGFTPRPALSLAEIERLIGEHRLMTVPSRQTLIRMIQRGVFEARLFDGLGWHIYEDSFWTWAGHSPPLAAAKTA
ncbi:MAG: hypothetical protein WBO10_07915 [Pyrinomonadaceae bacterium]